jgi:hypothetical protein
LRSDGSLADMNDDDREAQQYLEEQEQQYLETYGENENENV